RHDPHLARHCGGGARARPGRPGPGVRGGAPGAARGRGTVAWGGRLGSGVGPAASGPGPGPLDRGPGDSGAGRPDRRSAAHRHPGRRGAPGRDPSRGGEARDRGRGPERGVPAAGGEPMTSRVLTVLVIATSGVTAAAWPQDSLARAAERVRRAGLAYEVHALVGRSPTTLVQRPGWGPG